MFATLPPTAWIRIEDDGMNSDVHREHNGDLSKTPQAVLATTENAASTYSPTLRSARNQK